MSLLLCRAYPLLIPILLIAAAVALANNKVGWPANPEHTLKIFSGVIFSLGLLLGWTFNRSRIVLALLIVIGASVALTSPLTQNRTDLVDLLIALVPLNLLWIAFVKERGFFNRKALPRFALIAAQGVALVLAYRFSWRVFTIPRLGLESIVVDLAALENNLNVSITAAIVYLAVFSILFVRYLFCPDAVEAALLATVALCFLAADRSTDSFRANIWLASAGTILTLSVIVASHALAYRDPLTRLPARRSLQEALQCLSGRYCIAMVDIDHFKRVNDRHGHDVGDHVLRMVASKLASVNAGARAFRCGGEEFALLFPGRGRDQAEPYLEQLRETIEESGFTVRGASRSRGNQSKRSGRSPAKGTSKPNRLRITVSIGLAERTNGQSASEVMKAADKALYKAKRTGRNRVCAC